VNDLRIIFVVLIASIFAGAGLMSCPCGGDDDGTVDDDTDDDAGDDDDSSQDDGCYNPPTEPPDGAYLPIGVWYHWFGATGDEEHDRSYYRTTLADLAAHGIDMVIANFIMGENRVWFLEEAERHGIGVIMGVLEMTALIMMPFAVSQAQADDLAEELAAPIRDMPALYGYYIVDEPGIHGVIPENLAIAKQAFEKADPNHPSFSCFALLGKMQTYFSAMDPEVLLTDMYPLYNVITTPEMFIDGWHIDGFLNHLETARAIAGTKPVWLVAQAFANSLQWRMPIFEEISAMVYLALNRGASGIIYFCYQSTNFGEQLRGLLDLDGQPTENYERMTEFHRDIGPVKTALLWSHPVDSIARVQAGFDAAAFRHELGFHYVMVVNRDVISQQTAVVEIPASSLPNIEAVFDEATGEAVPFEQAGDVVRFSWTFDPGGGRMFRVCTLADR